MSLRIDPNASAPAWLPPPAPIDAEIEALRVMSTLLDALGPKARIRVLWWGLSKFCPTVPESVLEEILANGRARGADVAP